MEDPRDTRVYREARARWLRKVEAVCAWPDCPIPGRIVDKRLDGRNPWGPTLDHAVPFAVDASQFWNVANWRLMHRRCNLSKGQRTSLVGGVAEPSRLSAVSEEERFGLTSEELAAWRARGLAPNASRQWFDKDEYLGLPVPVPSPGWWPTS
jgi:hypothetical protein